MDRIAPRVSTAVHGSESTAHSQRLGTETVEIICYLSHSFHRKTQMKTNLVRGCDAMGRTLKQACWLTLIFIAGLACFAGTAAAQSGSQATADAAIQDPPRDPNFPARMEVLHIPSGGVKINGVAMVASGPGPHPVFVLFHGLPGNEKNLDLAQAVRRAGWTVVTLNYRGSWGSPGKFRFAQNLADARAVLAFLREPSTAKRLGLDTTRVAIGGHSMGGWVAAQTVAADRSLLGAVIISAADMGSFGVRARSEPASIEALMNDSREALAGVTGKSMTDELAAHGPAWSFRTLAPELKETRLLVLYSNDLVKAHSEALIADLKASDSKFLTTGYAPTDHSWSDSRIKLSSLVIKWLGGL